MSDTLKAQAGSLKAGIEKLDAEIAEREGTVAVMKADRDNMARELGSVERFLEAEGVSLPYQGKAGL